MYACVHILRYSLSSGTAAKQVAREVGDDERLGRGRTLVRGQAAPMSVGPSGTMMLPEDLGSTLGDAQEMAASAGEVHVGGVPSLQMCTAGHRW